MSLNSKLTITKNSVADVSIINGNYTYYKFYNGFTYSFTFRENTTCKLFMIGGGGGTSISQLQNKGGCGAGEYYKDTAYTFYSNVTYKVSVGGGGVNANGGNTTITSNDNLLLTVLGGGIGGKAGGCGGGQRTSGYTSEDTEILLGVGITLNGTYIRGGYNGGTRLYSTTAADSSVFSGGGGGGCGGIGSNSYVINNSNYNSGAGGNGIAIDFTGNIEYYGGGGAGGMSRTIRFIEQNIPTSIGGSVNGVIIGGYHNGVTNTYVQPVANTGSGGNGFSALYIRSYTDASIYTTTLYPGTPGAAGIVIISFLENIKLSEKQSNISSSTTLFGNGSGITGLDYDKFTIGTKPNLSDYARISSVSTTDKVYNAVRADTIGTLKTHESIINNNFICSNITTSTQVYCSSEYGVYYYKFLAGSNYSFSFNTNTTCKLFMIGGGAGGGSDNTNLYGGSGAGAYYKDTAYTFNSNITYRVYVGIGGISATNGSNTYITSNNTTILTAKGGGKSEATGGCGGGGGVYNINYAIGDGITTGVTYSRGGYNGGNAVKASGSSITLGGGGGGCGGNGGNAYYINDGNLNYGSGGNGISIDFTGTTEYYGGGGAGGGQHITTIKEWSSYSIGGSVGNVIIGGYHNGILHSNIPPVANTGSGGATFIRANWKSAEAYTWKYNETSGSDGVVIIAFLNNINITNINIGIDVANPMQKLDVNGKIKCLAIGTSSDIRLKTDILTLENSLYKVLNLRGVEYNINKKCIGLIAQETENIIPEVVITSSIDGYKSIEYANIVALLIEAIKEQNKLIENLELNMQKIENNLKNN